jgi:hypothetical protein
LAKWQRGGVAEWRSGGEMVNLWEGKGEEWERAVLRRNRDERGWNQLHSENLDAGRMGERKGCT